MSNSTEAAITTPPTESQQIITLPLKEFMQKLGSFADGIPAAEAQMRLQRGGKNDRLAELFLGQIILAARYSLNHTATML
jgi:hypothetical protein